MAITSESSPAAVTVPAPTPVLPKPSSSATPAPLSVGIGRVYEQFLELPVAFVLGVLWLAGAALMGSCALLLVLAVSALI